MIRVTLPVCVLALLAHAAAAEADDIVPMERMPAGHKLQVAAELGTTRDILGRGFDRALSDVAPNGQVRRVYPVAFKEVPVKQYEVSFELIENALELDANARFLFVRAGVKRQSDRRYMVLRVSYIDKVAVLRPKGRPRVDSDLYASKLYYGWALYIVIEGETSSFTTDVAATLQGTGAGAKLENTVRAHQLSSHVHAIGLQAKEVGAVVIATTAQEIEKSFKTPEASVPILVEYMTRRELDIEALPWTRAELIPGKYRIDVKVEVLSNKKDGRSWDGMGGGPPDPVVALYVDQTMVATCKQQDAELHLCLNGQVVEIGATSEIHMEVWDQDFSEHDDIGTAGPLQPIGHAGLNKPVYLPTQGQIKSAEITFRPLSQHP
jgi:hypothetical protein